MRRSVMVFAALTAVLQAGTIAQASTPIRQSCTEHPEWPYRKYDCYGTGIANDPPGYCTTHWTSPDDGGDWENAPEDRVISQSCVGPYGTYECHEIYDFGPYQCTGAGVRDGGVCTQYSWTDDDPDPYPDQGGHVTSKDCYYIT